MGSSEVTSSQINLNKTNLTPQTNQGQKVDKPYRVSGKKMKVDSLTERSLKVEFQPEPLRYKYPMKLAPGDYHLTIENEFSMTTFLDHYIIPTKHFSFTTDENADIKVDDSVYFYNNKGTVIVSKPWLKVPYNPSTLLVNIALIIGLIYLFKKKYLNFTFTLAAAYFLLIPIRIADDMLLFKSLGQFTIVVFIFERFFTANR